MTCLYLLLLLLRRLKEFKDTCHVFILTLDIVTHKFPIFTATDGLPHDCFSIIACSSDLSGVIVISGNALIYIDQVGRKLALPVNGWASRVSDMQMQPLTPEEQTRDLHLEGSFAVFVDTQTFFLITREGLVYPVEVVRDARAATRLSLGQAMSQTTVPCFAKRVEIGASLRTNSPQQGETIIVGSISGPTAVLKTTRVEEQIQSTSPSVVADNPMVLDVDDDGKLFMTILHRPHCYLYNSGRFQMTYME